MYTKTINGHQVFNTCKTIQLGGVWISNPSAEQIAAAGWEVYVPPVVPPQPLTEPDYEQVISAVKKFLSSETEELSDEDALAVAALYPTWASKLKEAEEEGKGVKADERLWYDTKLYKVNQPHVPQVDWTPDHTPALYTEISIVEWPEIPENIPSEAPWMNGDKGTWKGQHYICKMDNCVWNPDVLPSAWELQPQQS